MEEISLNFGSILGTKKSDGTIFVNCYDLRLKKYGELQRWQNEIVPEFFENGSYNIKRRGSILPLIIGNESVQVDFIEDIAMPICESSAVIAEEAYFDVVLLVHGLCIAYEKLRKSLVPLSNFIWDERKIQIEHTIAGAKKIGQKLPNKVKLHGWRADFLDPFGMQINFEKIF